MDGSIHAVGDHPQRDEVRTRHLEALGLHVIRFANEAVIHNMDSVLTDIQKHLW